MTQTADPKSIVEAVIEPWENQDSYLYGYTIVGRARIETNQGGFYRGLVVHRPHLKEDMRVVFWNKTNNTFASIPLGKQQTVLGDASDKQTQRVEKMEKAALMMELDVETMSQLTSFFAEALSITKEPGRQHIRIIIG